MRISFIPKGWGALRLSHSMETMLRRVSKHNEHGFPISEHRLFRTRNALVRRDLITVKKDTAHLTQKAVDILQEEARLQGWADIVPAIAKTP